MPQADFKLVAEYISKAIRKAVPRAEEVISYKMPAYKLHGGPLLSALCACSGEADRTTAKFRSSESEKYISDISVDTSESM